MARSKHASPPVKPKFIVLMIGVSVLLFLVIAAICYYLRLQQIAAYKDTLTQLEQQYDAAEKSFDTITQAIIIAKTPVDSSQIARAITTYNTIGDAVNRIHQSFLLPSDINTEVEGLLGTIQQRQVVLTTFQNLNDALIIETNTQTTLNTYASCKKAINYAGKANTVVTSLQNCGQYITQAQSLVLPLTTKGIYCQTEQSPGYILLKLQATHNALTNYYLAATKHDVRAVAAADIAYKNALKTYQKLPVWYSCITDTVSQEKKTLNL